MLRLDYNFLVLIGMGVHTFINPCDRLEMSMMGSTGIKYLGVSFQLSGHGDTETVEVYMVSISLEGSELQSATVPHT